MANQGLRATKPEVGTLSNWREAYAEACERVRQAAAVGTMSIRRSPDERLYAVAVEDKAGLWLSLWVRRSPRGEYFVLIPRSDGAWNPHASWHFDGTFHHKTYGHPTAARRRQRPDASFKGTENMITTPISADACRIGAVCRPSEFDGVLMISASRVRGRHPHLVSVDLAEAKRREVWQPGSRIADQRIFEACLPSVIITLWEPIYAPTVGGTDAFGE